MELLYLVSNGLHPFLITTTHSASLMGPGSTVPCRHRTSSSLVTRAMLQRR